jgi:hypothetical protein
MEQRPKLTDDEYMKLIERNRNRYSAIGTEQQTTLGVSSFKDKIILDDTDLL